MTQELKKAKLLWDQFMQQKCYFDTIKMMKERNNRNNFAKQLNLMIDEQDQMSRQIFKC